MIEDAASDVTAFDPLIQEREDALDSQSLKLLEEWPGMQETYQGDDPTRMFAGEGDPFRTNRRFKYLSSRPISSYSIELLVQGGGPKGAAHGGLSRSAGS
jgi:hypothetical protein